MRIAIDITPLKKDHFLQHRVRGTGFYIENLRQSLLDSFPNNIYTFFTRGGSLPRNIDLVHYPYFEPFFKTLPINRAFPTIVTVHDLIPLVFPKYFPPGIRGKLKWQVQKRLLGKSSAIITDSNASKKDIIKFTGFPHNKIYVIYLAASSEFKKVSDWQISHDMRKKYQLPEKYALYVGDATWNKNLPRLIEAIRKINLTLVMVGKALTDENVDESNPWNQDLLKVQELAKGDKRIIRLGFVPTEDLIGIYNAARVFAMPSIYEGFGLPVLEAMAAGTSVVTTKCGSLPEVAGEAGYYVDPYDVDDIANGIGEVFFTDRLRIQLIKKGLAQAEKFSWKKTAYETMQVYNQVNKEV